eukprot:gene5200-5254_t
MRRRWTRWWQSHWILRRGYLALLALPGVMRQATPADGEAQQKAQSAALAEAVSVGFGTALEAMVAARLGEGARLEAILGGQIGEVSELCATAAIEAADQPALQRARMLEAVQTLLGAVPALPEDLHEGPGHPPGFLIRGAVALTNRERDKKRVEYTFHFSDVWTAREELLWGAALTIRLSAISMVLSLGIAVFGALARTSGPKWLRIAVAAYVEFVRNTPFLVQVFVIFFGLPALGVRLEANTGALIAMVLNGSAYTIEIVRAGIEAISHGQVEAAYALGLHRLQAFRSIVLPQALRAVFAPLGSQFILLMLNSS